MVLHGAARQQPHEVPPSLPTPDPALHHQRRSDEEGVRSKTMYFPIALRLQLILQGHRWAAFLLLVRTLSMYPVARHLRARLMFKPILMCLENHMK